MSPDEFLEVVEEHIEKTFPKGECKERGQAVLLVALIAQSLRENGIIKEG